MCLMCGDPFQLELPLGPLLNHDMCRVLADTPYCITLDLFLEATSKQKVEVEVASFHGGNRLHQGLFHGYILVYSAKRRASLATLKYGTKSEYCLGFFNFSMYAHFNVQFHDNLSYILTLQLFKINLYILKTKVDSFNYYNV